MEDGGNVFRAKLEVFDFNSLCEIRELEERGLCDLRDIERDGKNGDWRF